MNIVTPSGFRDVLPEEAAMRERVNRSVQDLFAEEGYLPVETPTLEVMDVMRAGGRIPASPFKFFDSRGDLLAMRPDVTMQIARLTASHLTEKDETLRLRYTQRVFREEDNTMMEGPRELTQIGIECIGSGGAAIDGEVLILFVRALQTAGVFDFSLALATVGPLRSLLDRSGAPDFWKAEVLSAYHESNFVDLDRLTDVSTLQSNPETVAVAPAYAEAIRALPRIRGGLEAIDEVRALVTPLGCADGLDEFEESLQLLQAASPETTILVDFSVMSSFDYYTGLVFEAYGPRLATPLGSGGRYDTMIAAYGQKRPAAGFAFYLEQVCSALAEGSSKRDPERPLRIAVPKGALNADAIRLLQAAGLDTEGLDNPGRAMVISRPDVEYIMVRPSDAPIFVALGAADCGICGKDSLVESGTEGVELVDLAFGECRFIVAELKGTREAIEDRYRALGSLRVATKYPNVARAYFARTGVQVDLVKLHGNIELAPLTGVADRIVDITATGTTLRENDLIIVDEVLGSTARFFANTCAFRTDGRIVELAQALKKAACDLDFEPIAGAGAVPLSKNS